MERIRKQTSQFNWKYARQKQCEIHIAVAYIVLGDHEKAIEALQAASEMDGPIALNRELDHWFIFDRLKIDPRYDALIGERSSSNSARLLNTELEIVPPPDEKSIAILPFDSIGDEPEFKAALAIVEADLARQLANLRRMEAKGELAPLPDDPRYQLDRPADMLSENRNMI